MYISPLRWHLQFVGRYWLLIVAIVFFVYALMTATPTWAASVPVSANQSIPPFAFDLHLPQIVDPPKLISLREYSSSVANKAGGAWSPDGRQMLVIHIN